MGLQAQPDSDDGISLQDIHLEHCVSDLDSEFVPSFFDTPPLLHYNIVLHAQKA